MNALIDEKIDIKKLQLIKKRLNDIDLYLKQQIPLLVF